ncbi:MAG: nucleotidyl transferase AbiEii/AbiGii toxin family protein [Trichlorobacter sp.]|uniref:nucleotidyl transferase AbiEii/AbiGii toxin family protein n=1 Tax=Trichlorobacter sp. TaxID=2911007 RepID=UPI0025613F2D|nr:nucleotidyl transferase AbiEii/AbiGii toxin family protein [Trichlorobacter sp.]MDK9717168.1 nucleotidyl transferase AbiEii/AbiGii toxin family protein [Trichlorobacter sp.]
MTAKQTNMAASVRQKLLNKAKAEQSDFNLILTRYGLERFLYRLGKSNYSNRFVLKGAMLFPLWGIEGFRTTRDIDLAGFDESDLEELKGVFQIICQTQAEDDGITFDSQSIQAEDIRDQMEYGGTRLTFNAELAGARIIIQVDVGFGDTITPEASNAIYPTILELPAPHLRVYPAETVIAEKLEAMVKLGIANSRMKDFYDIWTIARIFNFDGITLQTAIQRTFERRNTAIPPGIPLALREEFATVSLRPITTHIGTLFDPPLFL